MLRNSKRSPSNGRVVLSDLSPQWLRLAGGLVLVSGLVACSEDDDKKPSGSDTGADTAVEDTGSDTGADDTGTSDTGAEDTGTADTAVEDTGTDTAVEDTGGSGDTTVEDTGSGSGSGDTTVEDTGGSGDTSLPSGFVVFGDEYGANVRWAPFGGSTNSVEVDTTESAAGTASLRIEVPASGYTGGAMVGSRPESFVGYNAISFWAKSSRPASLNAIGMGNDAVDTEFQSERRNLALTTEWTKYTLPLLAPDRLSALEGLFHFAEGSDEGAYTIWLDEVTYETIDTLGIPSGAFGTSALDLTVGQTTRAAGLVANTTVAGEPVTLFPAPIYFDWSSSNTATATVDASGLVTAVGGGSATITATLEGTAVGGTLTIDVVDGPATAAPTPTTAAGDVIASIYSGAYPAAPVDTFRTPWSAAVQSFETVAGDETLVYSSLDYVGIEFTGANSIDATEATYLHFDIWSPNTTGFGVKIVDFGADNGYGGGDDTQAQIDLSSASTPPLTTNGWVSYDLPLSAFVSAGLTNRANLSQLILVGRVDGVAGVASAYIDNFYFYRGDVPPPPSAPTSAAPIPVTPEAAVVASLFSGAYTASPVTTFRTDWSASAQSTESIAGDDTLLYSGLDYAGIEFTGGNALDISTATHIHFDAWTPNATEFAIKLVDFGPNNAFEVGGDNTEAQLNFTATSTPALTTGSWISFDIALEDFVAAGLANRANLSQIILVGRVAGVPGVANVYLDNLYFYEEVSAATRSVFGDEYGTDVGFFGFGGSTNNVSVDTTEFASGTASLRVEVPAGGYTGGALATAAPQDLSAFNAVTFWAKASQAVTLNTAGVGNDAVDTSMQLERRAIAVGTDWAQYTIPLLDGSKLSSMTGLFHFAEGSDEGAYTLWFDEITFVEDTSIGALSGSFGTASLNLEVGRTTAAAGLVASATDRTGTITVYPSGAYFDWFTSDSAVATVSSAGVVTGVAAGTSEITATLGGTAAGGALTITVVSGPGRAAPVPTLDQRDVEATIFSDAYTVNAIDTYGAPWSTGSQTLESIAGDNALLYSSLGYAGIEFIGANVIDASAATTLHVDVWTANASEVAFKLVDFGADNDFQGSDNSEAEIRLSASSSPALVSGAWVGFDLALADFESLGLRNRANLSQFVLSATVGGAPGIATVYLDNIYFY